MVNIEDGVGGERAHLVDDLPRGAAGHTDGAVSRALEIDRERERAEVTPARRGDLVAGRARQLRAHAQLLNQRRIVADHVVVGGDDRLGPLHIDVVDSPTISRMTLRCEYPSYMHRAARDIPVAGLMQVPRGTQVRIGLGCGCCGW